MAGWWSGKGSAMHFRIGTLLLLSGLTARAADEVDFGRDIRPILSGTCFHCHGQDEESRKAKLRLDLRDEATKPRDDITPIVPGKLDASEVWRRINTDDTDDLMPPPKSKMSLTKDQIAKIGAWIKQGAPYTKHWAFEPPKLPSVPALPRGATAKNPIDHFIAAKLKTAGLKQSPEADPDTLARRLSLDLVGLPMAREDAEKGRRGDTEKLVERLLASEHFGEKWARMWLDVARYADSTGYGSDQLRLNMWPYRDWVIAALNANMPYDQFTIEQLAGDLLPNASVPQQLATAFHRQTMMNTEGGTDDEEYRVIAVKDRVNTTMQVWMGLTAGCAQCHTHKFDPITHHEYYSLFAIFNQTEDADRGDDSPLMPVATGPDDARRAKIEDEIATLRQQTTANTPEFERELADWIASAGQPVPWTPLEFVEGTSKNGDLIAEADGTIKAVANVAANERFEVQFRTKLDGITAWRLETLPEAGTTGEAALTGIAISAQRAGEKTTRGRFVRVEGVKNQIIHLAEVQVFGGGANLAPKGKASQSTTGYGGEAARAIDGETAGEFAKNSVSHNSDRDPAPFWEVDLGSEQPIERIVLWNRADGLESRIVGAKVVVLDGKRSGVFSAKLDEAPQPSAEFALSGAASVELVGASSDLDAPGNNPAMAFDAGKDTGWRVALDAPHAAVFEAAKPLAGGDEVRLTVSLSQAGKGTRPFTRFRIAATTVAGPVREWPRDVRDILALEAGKRTAAQQDRLAGYFRPQAKSYARVNKAIEAKQAELAKIKPVQVPVMKEKSSGLRKSHVFAKGNYLTPTDEVHPEVLASFHPAPTGKIDRLALAKWLVAPGNPMTARVAVNRIWAQLFGVGLVETEEDFGTQGAPPSHPELLDWLAVTFQTPKASGGLGWDTKALIKLIVSSQTYRQSSVASAEAAARDPRNRLVSHYPRRRLEAEAIRDQALALAGLLSPRLGGPSVYPPQPDGLWVVAFRGKENYPTSTGEDRWRRSLYTIWRRIAPHPSMAAFDAPSREICTVRRLPTNTPLQSFVTLNDPVYVEAAQGFARRMAREATGSPRERIRWALELALARPATETQVGTLAALYERTVAEFRAKPDEAKKLAASTELPLPAGVDPAELAAWTTVANVLLNLDAVLVKS